MTWIEIGLLALALSADAFSVSAAVGLTHRGRRRAFRIVWHFGLFQGLFALAGALMGTILIARIRAWDHWIVLLLLGIIGGRMIYNSLKGNDPEEYVPQDLTRGMVMIGLSVAVSIDAFAAGISLPASNAPIYLSCLVITLATLCMSTAAWFLAGYIQPNARRGAEFIAGLILIGIGIRTVLDHLSRL
jgi:putative Mn2+ efflux pump MntP